MGCPYGIRPRGLDPYGSYGIIMSVSEKVMRAKLIGGGVLGVLALGIIIFVVVKLSSLFKDVSQEIEDTTADVKDIAQDTVVETYQDIQDLEDQIGRELEPPEEFIATYTYSIDEIIEGCNEKIADPNESKLTKTVSRGIKWYIAYLAILNPFLLLMYLIGKKTIADLQAECPEPLIEIISPIEVQHRLTFGVRLYQIYYSVDNTTARLELNKYYQLTRDYLPPELRGFADRTAKHPLWFTNVDVAMKETWTIIKMEIENGITMEKPLLLPKNSRSGYQEY